LEAKKVLFAAQTAVKEATETRIIAETEAKKRLDVQEIKLQKWIATNIEFRKVAMAASIKAREASEEAHDKATNARKERIQET